MTGQSKTIVALSSGSLPSGVAVIRLSGSAALDAVRELCGGLPPPRRLSLVSLIDPQTGVFLDRGMVAVFPAPNSFTGEDCAELQVHGSPAGIKAILATLCGMPGISLAGPGDFARRAFENGKLDLTAIEGLGDLLAAETEHQRRQALARLEGELSTLVVTWRNELLAARAEIEAHLDFSDEDDVPFALPAHFSDGLAALAASMEEAFSGFERGRIVREGFSVVLAGAPNAGKSSLLNALAGSDLAIVTAEAGTTRDTKDVAIDLGGSLVILTDTAGLRETGSLAEAEGIRRARTAMTSADLVLWLIAPDADAGIPSEVKGDTPVWTIATKSDLGPTRTSVDFAISTNTGEGIGDLLNRLQSHMEDRFGAGEPVLISHMRDRMAIEAAVDDVKGALAHFAHAEICAEDLRRASDRLAGLIGLIDSEAVLDRLFAGFCIGK
ncbi:tRNA uridine-5-carboxymethylaminomethyl(34) synthesis GTPase MnmE [Pelagibacterium limicola]|uniref:tRNA uridine-5-carboxymethylaminomethyl(34) synthesis GTPase MnmE n=1 Tax=Pelagibacterium limicola TaxID=2791022 RepID=UPI0018AF5A34